MLNVEDDIAGFLGVHIKHADDGCVCLTRTGLIDRILVPMHLDDANHKMTSSKGPRGRDLLSPFSQ